MIDQFKLVFFKRVLVAAAFIIVFLIGLGFGQMGKKSQSAPPTKTSTTKKTKAGSELTEKWVKQFLVAYFTKKDLEENRNRYETYMTEGMYNSTVAEEDKAQNQAYKGYVINYALQSAQIYIDKTNNQAICYVTYTNDLLQKKDETEGAQLDVSNNTVIQLDYNKVDGTYLVNHMSTLLISDSSNPTDTQEAYGNITPTEED